MPKDLHLPQAGLHGAHDELKQGAFPRAVRTNHSDALPFLGGKADFLEGVNTAVTTAAQ